MPRLIEAPDPESFVPAPSPLRVASPEEVSAFQPSGSPQPEKPALFGIPRGLATGLKSGAIYQGYFAPDPSLPPTTPGDVAVANYERTGVLTPEAQAELRRREAEAKANTPGFGERIAQGVGGFVGTAPEFAAGAVPGFVAGGPPGAIIGGMATAGAARERMDPESSALDVVKGAGIGAAEGVAMAAGGAVGGKLAAGAARQLGIGAAQKTAAQTAARAAEAATREAVRVPVSANIAAAETARQAARAAAQRAGQATAIPARAGQIAGTTAALGTTGPVLQEGRLPTPMDYADALGFVVAMSAAGAITKGVARKANIAIKGAEKRGEPLDPVIERLKRQNQAFKDEWDRRIQDQIARQPKQLTGPDVPPKVEPGYARESVYSAPQDTTLGGSAGVAQGQRPRIQAPKGPDQGRSPAFVPNEPIPGATPQTGGFIPPFRPPIQTDTMEGAGALPGPYIPDMGGVGRPAIDPMPRLMAMRQDKGAPLTTAEVKAVVGGTRENVKALRDQVNQSAPTPLRDQSGDDLGALSARYESSGDPATVSTGKGDPGGVSYGLYQFASNKRTPQRFVSWAEKQGAPWAAELKWLKPGSPEFSAKWREISERNPEEFAAAQHAFTKEKYYDVAVNMLRERGIDIAGMPKAVHDAVWSMAVQHGPGATKDGRGATALVEQAYRNLAKSPDDPIAPPSLISEMYRLRRERYTMASIQARFKAEERDALAALSGEPTGRQNVPRGTQPQREEVIADERQVQGQREGRQGEVAPPPAPVAAEVMQAAPADPLTGSRPLTPSTAPMQRVSQDIGTAAEMLGQPTRNTSELPQPAKNMGELTPAETQAAEGEPNVVKFTKELGRGLYLTEQGEATPLALSRLSRMLSVFGKKARGIAKQITEDTVTPKMWDTFTKEEKTAFDSADDLWTEMGLQWREDLKKPVEYPPGYDIDMPYDPVPDAVRALYPYLAPKQSASIPGELTPAAVNAAAREAKSFGDMAFISDLHQRVAPDMPIAEFKEALVSMHRKGDIELNRADLVEAMDPAKLAASEARYLNSQFHFVRAPQQPTRQAVSEATQAPSPRAEAAQPPRTRDDILADIDKLDARIQKAKTDKAKDRLTKQQEKLWGEIDRLGSDETGAALNPAVVFDEITKRGKAFSRDLYEQAKPTLRDLYDSVRGAAGKTVEFIREAMRRFGTAVRPYAKRFVAEAKRMATEERGAILSPLAISDRAKQITKKWLTSRGDFPQEAFDLKNKMQGERAAMINQANRIAHDFNRALKKSFGTKKLDPATREQINSVFDGHPPVPGLLPQSVIDATTKFRASIDAMSSTMINEGLVDPNLAQIITNNQGEYVRRTYRVHREGEGYVKKLDPQLKEDYKNYLKAQGTTLTENQLDQEINATLREHTEHSMFGGFHRGGGLGKDTSIFKKRQNLPKELRDLLGEDRDPHTRYVQSITKMADFIAKQRFLNDVRQAGMGKFFYEQSDTNIDPRADTLIAAEGSEALAPLNGLYTYPEVAAAFKEALEPTSKGGQMWMRANAIAKYMKVVLSPKAQIRQSLGNTMFMLANGHNPFQAETARGIRKAFQHFTNTGDSTAQSYLNEAAGYGILDDGALAGEFATILREGGLLDKPPLTVASKLYQAGDNYQRLALWELEQRQYRKALPSASDAEIKQIAADIVNNQSPTYSRVSQAVREFRRIPLIGPFATFSAEILRTSKNIAQQIKREMGDSNPAIRKIGAKRLVGLTLAAATGYALEEASRYALGITREEDDAYRKVTPDYMKYGNWVYTGRGDDGKATIVDTSYSNPYAYIVQIVNAALSDQDTPEKIWAILGRAVDPFTQEHLVTAAVADIWSGIRRETGRPLWGKTDTPVEVGSAITKRLVESLEPGAVPDARNIARGLQGKGTESTGRPIDPVTEAIGVVTGQRRQEIDPLYSLKWKARDFNDKMGEGASKYTRVVRRPDTQTTGDLVSAYQRAADSREKAFAEMAELTQAVEFLVGSRAKVARVLMESGISKENIGLLFNNKATPYIPPDDTIPKDDAAREQIRDLIRGQAATRP